MKKILKYSFLLGTLFLTACGGNDNVSNSEELSGEETSSEVTSLYDDSPLKEREFRVRVLYENGEPCYSEGMRAQWCSPVSCYVPTIVDANGYARITIPEDGYDEYVIHLTKLPVGYTYNPNAYIATSTNRDIEIVLSEYQTGTIEEVLLQGEEAVNVNIVSEGVFKATIDSQNGKYFFGFNPSKPGKFKIESWAYDFAGVVTKLNYYSGSLHYVPSAPSDVYEGEGLNGNFSYILNCPSTTFTTDETTNNLYSGATYVFSITVESTGLNYPFEFPYEISYIDEADEPETPAPVETVDVYATETLSVFEDKPTGTVLTAIPLDGSIPYFYNEEDRFYHLESVDGPLVLVALNRQNPYISPGLAQIHTSTYGDTNYLITDNDSKNYEPMIMEYSKNCNSNGVYPATEELRTFIEYLIVEHEYFDERYGFVSTSLDFTVSEEYQWLFPCYYYKTLA